MDLNAGFIALVTGAFVLGALHAFEPGHGKSIMGAYLVASRGGIRHALLLGALVTITHTIVVFVLAVAALLFAQGQMKEDVTWWLGVVSAALVILAGTWMSLRAFNVLGRSHGHQHHPDHDEKAQRHEHDHPHAHEHAHEHRQPHNHAHPHAHPHDPDHSRPRDHDLPGEDAAHEHEHGHAHDEHEAAHGHSHEVRVPRGRDPLGFWTLLAVGTSGGLVPCPAALTAFLAAVHLGRVAAGIAIVASLSLGIAASLMLVGVLFVKARDWTVRRFSQRGLSTHLQRISAVLITLIGIGMLLNSLLGQHPGHAGRWWT